MLAFLFGLVLGILLTLALLGVVIWLLLRGSNRASAAHVLVAAALALKGKQTTPNAEAKYPLPGFDGDKCRQAAPPTP